MQYKSKTVNPRWMEQFEIHMFDELTSHLEVNVCDHDIVSTREELLGKLVAYGENLIPRISYLTRFLILLILSETCEITLIIN